MSQNSSSFRFIHYLINALLAIIAFVVILVLAFPIGFYGMAMYISPSLPSVSEMKAVNLEMPLQIYSQDNKLIGQYGNRMSLPVAYDDIPKDFINAFLAAEDSSFYEHSGISIKGLGRAVTEIITDDDRQTGGSTITMQVAKNYFLTPERTFNRKLTELYLARKIEDELDKEDILTLYVNKIYMGEGAYGIRAAAKKYFSKSLENLTIAEMATLAGLPKAPSQNNPVSNPDEALTRRNWIIGQMLTLGFIDQEQHDKAVNQPLGVRLYQEKLDVNMPYLAEMTRHALVSRYGQEVVNSGWRVKLTVNSEQQSAADTAVKKGLIGYDRRHGWRSAEANGEPLSSFTTYANMVPAKVTEVGYRSFKAELKNGEEVTVPWSGMRWAKRYLDANRIRSYPSRAGDIVAKDDIVRLIANENKTDWRLTQIPKVQGSLVALDPDTGAIISLIGGFDYRYSKFNRATQGWRQPGSTIKPLNYAAALEKGYTPDSMISDGPLRIGNWKPKNSDGRFYGDMTVRRGLYLSRNLVSIRLLQAVGTSDARQLLDNFGLDKEKLPTTLSLALGAGQATPLQMAVAYAAFANGGHRVQPYFIDEIYNYNNSLLYKANPQRACAACFNQNLEKRNETLKEEYEKQQEQALKQREETIKTLEASLDQSETQTETEDNESAATSNEEQQKNIDALRYNGSPQSDRLKPTLTQYTIAEQAPRILKPKVAYDMASMLRDVIQIGTGRRAKALGRNDIGGKTGTTNDMKDAWFAGFHPTAVSIVWVGFDQPATLGRGEYGGVAALPIWVDFMRQQLKSTPYQWVSVNNKAKSELQNQEIINIANDEDEAKLSDRITNRKLTSSMAPPKAALSEREPEPEPIQPPNIAGPENKPRPIESRPTESRPESQSEPETTNTESNNPLTEN